jgi:hypothetical protein
MSPEQCLGSEVGPPADVYAAGVILYELLAGDVPFVGSPSEVLLQHIRQAPPRLEELSPRCPPPPRLASLALGALAKQAEQRPTTRQFREELALALADVQATVPAAAGAPAPADGDITRGEAGGVGEVQGTTRPAGDGDAASGSESTGGLLQRIWRPFRRE